MQAFGKILAFGCVVLFIITGVMALLFFNIEQKAFSSGTYKQAFEEQNLYDRVPAILATALSTSLAENQSAQPFLKALTVQDWQNSISSLLPPEELKAMADHTLDSTFDYLNGKTDSAVISLLPLKAHLAGEAGLNVVRQVLRLQPECTPEQLTQMAFGLLEGQITLCNPPEAAIGFMAPFIQTQLHVMTAAFPNEITFIPGRNSGTPDDPRLRLNTIRLVMQLSVFVPLALLLLIVLFAVRSLSDWLQWWGWPFMITGFLSLLIALLGSPLVGWILQLLIQIQAGSLIPPILSATIGEAASAVTRQILTPVALEGAVLAILGLMMVILSMFVTSREKTIFISPRQ